MNLRVGWIELIFSRKDWSFSIPSVQIKKISSINLLYSSIGFSGQRDIARSHNFLSMTPIVMFAMVGAEIDPIEMPFSWLN